MLESGMAAASIARPGGEECEMFRLKFLREGGLAPFWGRCVCFVCLENEKGKQLAYN